MTDDDPWVDVFRNVVEIWHGPGRRMKSCRQCAGTGEYPPTGGGVCSWCEGEGEVPAEGDDG
jgi:hypothetical protein